MDFVSDRLDNGRRFRSLTVVDIYTRESLVIGSGQSLRGEDVVRVLNRLKVQRGLPQMLFCDNGAEFTGQVMDVSAQSSTFGELSGPSNGPRSMDVRLNIEF